MMKHEESGVAVPPVHVRPADGAQPGKLGTQHAWTFGVPALAELSNRARDTSSAAARPGEFGTQHAWSFGVPALGEFANSARMTASVAGFPQNVIADDFWVVSFETGHKTGG